MTAIAVVFIGGYLGWKGIGKWWRYIQTQDVDVCVYCGSVLITGDCWNIWCGHFRDGRIVGGDGSGR